MRNLTIAAFGLCALLLSACVNGPTLPQIQQTGATLTSIVKTDVALYTAQHPLNAADQTKLATALNTLTAANVVLQSLTPTSFSSVTGDIGVAENVVAAAVSVVNALPSGTLPDGTVDEINAAALAFQLSAGLAQQIIVAAAPVVVPPGSI